MPGEQRVVTALLGQLDLEQADLRALGRVHRGAERGRQQLHAEADAEERAPGLDRIAHQLPLGASHGWSASSPAPIGPPIASTASNSRQSGSGSPSSSSTATASTPRSASPRENTPGCSQAMCWRTSRRTRSRAPRRAPRLRVLLLAGTRRPRRSRRRSGRPRARRRSRAVRGRDRERDDPERMAVEALTQEADLGVLGDEVDLLGGGLDRLLLGDTSCPAARRDHEREHQHGRDHREPGPRGRPAVGVSACGATPASPEGRHPGVYSAPLRWSGGTRRRGRCPRR